MSVRVQIDGEGAVCGAEVIANDTGSDELALCAAEYLRTPPSGYPAPQGGCIEATVPFGFEPRDPLRVPRDESPGSASDLSASGAAQPGSHGIGPEAIRKVVVAHRGEVMACYLSSGGADAGAGGTVTVWWRIAPNGTVTASELVASSMGNARAEGCIVRRVRTWHFPPSTTSSEITMPFALTAGTAQP